MATIESLPPESLIRILELASEPNVLYAYTQHPALQTLAASSLVARSWREPAQALLWLRVDIRRPGAWKRVLASPVCGKYRSEHVVLSANALGQEGSIQGVLERLRGVLSLKIVDTGSGGARYDAGWLDLPSLRDLTNLFISVYCSCDVSSDLRPVFRPVFRLRSLTLGRYACSAALNHALLAQSSSSLSSLTIYPTSTPSDLALLSSLPLVATQLSSLSLHGALPSLGSILPSFSALTHLTLTFWSTLDIPEYDTILSSFPSPIPSVTLVPLYHSHVLRGEYMVSLTEKMRGNAWRGVKKVYLPVMREVLEAKVAGKAFLDLCTERGVGLHFSKPWRITDQQGVPFAVF